MQIKTTFNTNGYGNSNQDKRTETDADRYGLRSLFRGDVRFQQQPEAFHWHVSGPGSYAQHMALDEALTTLADAMDRIVETTYAMKGDIEVVIPQTNTPRNIETHCEKFFKYIDEQREMFEEDFQRPFSTTIRKLSSNFFTG